MTIGITGATGQLGQLVVQNLKERNTGATIVALVRDPKKAADLGVDARVFDYNQPETLAEALKGIDKLLLISGNEIGNRTAQHTNVIEAAKKAGVKLIAYTSLLHADKSSLALAGEHLETETLLKESGIPYVILRHGWYTENYVGGLSGVVEHGTFYGSAGDGKIASASRADFAIVDAEVLVTEGHEGKTYELAGDEIFTLSDLAKSLSEVAGKEVNYQNLPVEEYAKVLEGFGLPKGVAQFFAGTHIGTEKGDLFDDSKTLSKLIGKPTTSLKAVLKASL
ncbi:MAG: SDR family oxidoreductase [Flavobacterium sp.]|nr:SDR family oxidoreductase [Flavobacterium sp.]